VARTAGYVLKAAAYITTNPASEGIMGNSSGQAPVTLQELLLSSLDPTDALAKLLIDKGMITQQEFLAKIAQERATYQRMLNLRCQ
jgi:hypothetical protein